MQFTVRLEIRVSVNIDLCHFKLVFLTIQTNNLKGEELFLEPGSKILVLFGELH
jgi:hypothetical protein